MARDHHDRGPAVLLAMTAGPATLRAVGDVYRKALPEDARVRARIELRRTRAAVLELPPGDYYFVFDLFDGEGCFTLAVERAAVALGQRTYAAAAQSGNVFEFPVT